MREYAGPDRGVSTGVCAAARVPLTDLSASQRLLRSRPVTASKLTDAPATAQGYLEARPGDIAGRSRLVLVDVREEDELLDALGHIHGVRHVPLAQLLAQGLPDVDPGAQVVCICKAGGRSAKAATSLVARGFREVYSVSGGMIRWNAEERPVARTRTWT